MERRTKRWGRILLNTLAAISLLGFLFATGSLLFKRTHALLPMKGTKSHVVVESFFQNGTSRSRLCLEVGVMRPAPLTPANIAKGKRVGWMGFEVRHDYPIVYTNGEGHFSGFLVPYWALAMCFAIVPFMWLVTRSEHQQLKRPGLCPACGYDMRANPAKCSECGHEIASGIS